MLSRRDLVSALSAIGATWALSLKSVAQKQPVPLTPDKLALGESEVLDLLLLMDSDKNGKISKKEWMDFMSAEFDRLDKDKSGELDIRELAQSKLMATRHSNTGK